jgi:hypothetical protein
MTLKTAKLGGAASDVVVAKVAVSYATLSHLDLPHSFIAWAYDDDLDPNTYFG